MFLYIKSANAQIVILYNAFGLFDLHYSSSFIFFSLPVLFLLFCLFLLIFIIYMCIYSYTDLTNSYNIFTIILQFVRFIGLSLFSFFHSTSVLLVLFLYFLLNIYMYIHNYNDTIHSYNIFTIIEVSIFQKSK